ncbi:helix-turn-helix domain-containing protein [Crocinitomix catalasitica]|nr:helix-turn-helix domain-containing protein [Crocinitomix catalasitica]
MNKNFLANKISHLRKLKGLTQEELADRTNLSSRTIQRIESGEVDPRLYTLKVIAEALEISMEEFNTPPEEDERSPLALLHLSALSGFLVPCGNIFAPLLMWMHHKTKINHIEMHAKRVINAQISYSIYFLILFAGFVCFILFADLPNKLDLAISLQDIFDQESGTEFILLFPFLFIVWFPILLGIIFAIINGVRMYKGSSLRHYPLAIPFLR